MTRKKQTFSFSLLSIISLFSLHCSGPEAGPLSTTADTVIISNTIINAKRFVDKPGDNVQDFDSALLLAKQAADMGRTHAYTRGIAASGVVMSQVYRTRGQKDTGLAYAWQAVRFFEKTPVYKTDRADALAELANYYEVYDSAQIVTKTNLFRAATELIAETEPLSMKYANSLKYLADLYYATGTNIANDSAIYQARKALDVYKALAYDTVQDVYSILGGTYFQQRRMEDALKYQLLAAYTAERTRDSSAIVSAIYNRLGIIYNELERLDKVEACYLKALSFVPKENAADVHMITSNYMRHLIRMGDFGKAISIGLPLAEKNLDAVDYGMIFLKCNLIGAFAKTGQYKAGLKYAALTEKNLKSRENIGDNLWYAFYMVASQLYLSMQQYAEASKYQALMEQADNRSNQSVLKDVVVSLMKYQLDSATNAPTTFQSYRIYSAFRDSLTRKIYRNNISRLEVEYSTKNKDLELDLKKKEISNLKVQAELQQRTVKSERLVRNLLIAGGLLAVLLLVMLFKQYILKQKANMAMNRQNDNLKQLLTEREWLMKELHHRTNNNLQIVISLLDAQLPYLTDTATHGLIRESQQRMYSISLIHRKLYQKDAGSEVAMDSYLKELVDYIKNSFAAGTHISFRIQVAPVVLDVSRAVSVGLITNEAVTNAIKYAFPSGQPGTITITLDEADGRMVTLSVSDDGVGLPADYDPGQSTSLGMKLVYGLASQLEADVSVSSQPGTSLTLRFDSWKIKEFSPSREIIHEKH